MGVDSNELLLLDGLVSLGGLDLVLHEGSLGGAGDGSGGFNHFDVQVLLCSVVVSPSI